MKTLKTEKRYVLICQQMYRKKINDFDIVR